METLEFTADDKRLGAYNLDGSIASWPTVDAFGKPYVRVNATVKRVSSTQFIVVGPDEEKNIEGFSLNRAAPKSVKATE